MILLTTSAEENAEPYVAALRAIGFLGDEILVVDPERRDEAAAIAAIASGVLLSGGCDVDPARYGEAARPEAGVEALPERDALEWAVLGAARERKLPVWGICRGLQVANVFLGGTLWQDLPTDRPGGIEHSVPEPKDLLSHPVAVSAPGSPLGARLAPIAESPVRVNSRHHQAVRRLAPGLRAVAEAPDGLIEAFELADPAAWGDWWLRAVQWHPENLVALPEQRTLWDDFAAAVRRRGAENAAENAKENA